VIDLMEALKASVAETKKQPEPKKAKAAAGPKRRRAPARKSA
jgi:hypothetical protein